MMIPNWIKTFGLHGFYKQKSEVQGLNKKTWLNSVNPFKPEFIIVIFIHYKPRIAVAILDL